MSGGRPMKEFSSLSASHWRKAASEEGEAWGIRLGYQPRTGGKQPVSNLWGLAQVKLLSASHWRKAASEGQSLETGNVCVISLALEESSQ